MTKTSAIQYIYDSRKAHLAWVGKAEQLILGLSVDKDFIPLEATSCDFNKWLQSEGEKLKTLPSMDSIINKIEQHHNKLHHTYNKIYHIFFIAPNERSLLYKILTFNSKTVSKSEKKKANKYFNSLEHSSKELIEALQILEEQVKNMPSTELEKLYSDLTQ